MLSRPIKTVIPLYLPSLFPPFLNHAIVIAEQLVNAVALQNRNCIIDIFIFPIPPLNFFQLFYCLVIKTFPNNSCRIPPKIV